MKRLLTGVDEAAIGFADGVRMWTDDPAGVKVLAAVISGVVHVAGGNPSRIVWRDINGTHVDDGDSTHDGVTFDDGPYLFDTVKEFGEWLVNRKGV